MREERVAVMLCDEKVDIQLKKVPFSPDQDSSGKNPSEISDV